MQCLEGGKLQKSRLCEKRDLVSLVDGGHRLQGGGRGGVPLRSNVAGVAREQQLRVALDAAHALRAPAQLRVGSQKQACVNSPSGTHNGQHLHWHTGRSAL
jgi:hypothetical protein